MDNNILKEYKLKVDQLHQEFNKLMSNKLIPVMHGDKSYSLESIKEVQDNLEKQEFTISVCGQVNAGKSSFLNFLLFNDKEVLPADDTPWTAKLTTVRYGVENKATVTYYNSNEWESLKSQRINDDDGNISTYYDEFLKSDVNKVALEGLQVESFIAKENKIVDGIDLNNLNNYVSKGGQMTPFVKHVDIKVNNELTKGVVFVDTPGINDRNELRSQVTEDWIKKSSAVIYLFYAGQALSSADFVFIDQHLSSVPTDKILFALTKADISADFEGAKAFVERTLKEDKELKARKFITASKSVYPISTLAALLNYKQKNNIELTEDDEFHLERIKDESPSFIEKKGFIEDFISGLKSHLMKQTGKAIIDKTVEFIRDIYETNQVALSSDLKATKVKKQSLNLSATELKEKVGDLNNVIEKIEKFKTQFERGTIDETVSRIKSEIKIELKELKKNGFSSLEKQLQESTDDRIKSLRSLATHLTKEQLKELSDQIEHSLLNELSIKEQVNDLLETFSNKFEEVISDNEVYDGSVFCSVDNPEALVENIAYEELSVDKLKKECGKDWGINKNKVKNLIYAEIKKAYETHANTVIKTVLANVDNVIKQNIDEVYNNVNTEIKKLKSNTNDLLKSQKGKDEQRKDLQLEIIKNEESLDKLKSQIKSFQEWS